MTCDLRHVTCDLRHGRWRRAWLALAALACAVVGMLGIPVAAEAKTVRSTGNWNGTTYTIYDDNTAVVSGSISYLQGHKTSSGFLDGFESLPSDVRSCTTIDFSNVNMGFYNLQTMSGLFSDCPNLTSVTGLSNWNMSSVTDMSDMFYNCPSLTDLSFLDGLNTSHVTDMSGMFEGCSSLTDLSGLSNWNTSSVTDMSGMFGGCSSLTDLSGLANWDTSNVTDMSGMFGIGSDGSSEGHITSVDGLSHWNTRSLTDMSSMFFNQKHIPNVSGLSSWNTGNVTDMRYMFTNCAGIANVDGLSLWNTSNVTDMTGTFLGCSSLTNVNGLSNWDVSHVQSMGRFDYLPLYSSYVYGMFEDCRSLTDISGLKDWDTASVTQLDGMFMGCAITDTDAVATWDVRNVASMDSMLACDSLTSVNLSGWDTPAVTNAYYFAGDGRNVTSLRLGPNLTGTVLEQLPTPESNGTYNGEWVRSDETYGPYTPSELAANWTSDMAGTWVKAKNVPVSIRFDANGGTGTMSTMTTFVGWGVTLSANAFMRPGYAFSGWNTEAGGAGTNYADRAFLMPTSDMTLYAQWVPYALTVRYDANGGTGSMGARTITYASPDKTAGPCLYVRSGFAFVGWNTQSDGSGTSYAADASLAGLLAPDGSTLTLHAQWRAEPSDASYNGGMDVTLPANQQVTIEGLPAGCSYDVTEVPIPRGWTLVRSQDATGVIVPRVG